MAARDKFSLPALHARLDLAGSSNQAGSPTGSPACPPGPVPSVASAPGPGCFPPPLPSPQPRPGRNGARRGLPSWGALLQGAIALLSGAAVLLVGLGDARAPWGFLLGLASQPFWLLATWRARQWGMFLLSLWYTLAWAAGAWAHWL